jgi:GR25 family glycosyltransferase involved in LPS biosynthesis
MKKYVINLKRRPDRLQNFKNNFGNFVDDVEIVYGFDGKYLSNESKEEQELVKKCFNITIGEIGCALSHFRIYNDIINNNYDHAIIFEDDARPTNNFVNKLEHILYEIKKDYDFLYIGGRFHIDFKMPDQYHHKVSSNIVQHFGEHYGPFHDRTTHGYIISNKMARILLDIFNNNGLHRPFDHWLIEMLKKEKVIIYNSHPLLCYSPMNSDTDIR